MNKFIENNLIGKIDVYVSTYLQIVLHAIYAVRIYIFMNA